MTNNTPKTFGKVMLIVFWLALTMVTVYGQSSRKIEGQLDEYMAAIVSKSVKPELNELLSNDKNHKVILENLEKYYSDTTFDVRFEAYKLTYTIGIKSADLSVRQNVVDRITVGLSDQSSSLVGWSARHLSVFNRTDFTEASKNNLITGINSDINRLEEIIKIAGYLNLTGAKPNIENLAQTSRKAGVKWSAYIALSRMGDQLYINKVTNAVRNQGLNDNTVYELVPDLVYTRQKACIDLAVEFLFEDKKLCTSSNPDNPQRMECGYRIMEYLALAIKDFPFGVKTSGDIDTDDYPAALKTVREWFLSKESDYEIIDESF